MLYLRTALSAPARLVAPSAAVLGTLLCVAPAAQAEGTDLFTISAGAALVQDSNLFRLPSNANLPAIIGSDSASDQITITSVGVKFNKDYSLQRLELDLNLANYHYQNFNYLNNTANNYSAAWRWSVTPRVRGSLTTDRKETLNDFTDVRGYQQRNQRTNVTTRLDGAYELDGAWRLVAGAAESSQTNPQNQSAEADTVTRSTDIGARYVFASKSQLGFILRSAQGTYRLSPNQPSGLINESFDQLDQEATLRWAIDGKSTADFRVTALSRKHANFGHRDFNGVSAVANYNLNVTGKISVTAGWVRELSSYQTTTSNYTQTDRFSIAPVWQMSYRTQLRLRHEMVVRDYLGAPTTLAVNAMQRSETVRDTTLALDWQPQPHLTLNASVQDSRRSVNLANLDYQSTTASVSAQISF
jgi:exopolysaccharide biosynthesis operon protein EpsL